MASPDESSPKESSSKPIGGGPPSLLNVIMLYLCLLGMGAIGGYGTFYVVFSGRCAALLSQSEIEFNTSREEWKRLYDTAVAGKQQCLADTSAKEELYELQGRLEAQSTLADRHHALLIKQEDTLNRLSSLQLSQEVSSQTIENLRGQANELRRSLEGTTRDLQQTLADKERSERTLSEQLGLAESLLATRTAEVERLQIDQQYCSTTLPVLSDEVTRIKSYIRQRNHQVGLMDHGRGPFYVEFTLQFPETMGPAVEPNTFLVELAPLADMPHTIMIFMDLVDLQLFDGTSIVASSTRLIEGGSPNNAEVRRAVKLHERYAKYGYGRSPLAFNEYSPNIPHEAFTIGFSGTPVAGPAFAINMVDNNDERKPGPDGRGGEPCFGRVIRGFDTLTRIQSAPKSADGYRLAKSVEIVTVRKIRM